MPKVAKAWPLGRRVVELRSMTVEEREDEGWDWNGRACAVLVLDDGSRIYASGDDEGNHPGALFGAKGKKKFILAGGV